MCTCIVERDVLMTDPADSTPTSTNTRESNTKKIAESTLSTIKHHQSSPQQNLTNKTSTATNVSSTSSSALGANQRRTTSLLNIFSSNSQGMMI